MPDYSRAHVDRNEPTFKTIRESKIDFSSWRMWGSVLRYMLVCRVIENHAAKTGKTTVKLLDIGCSEATLAGFIEQNYSLPMGVDYYGIDVRFDALKVAHALYPTAKLRKHDLNAGKPLPFGTSFDIINAQQVIEHIGKEDGIKLVQDAFDALAPRGILILGAPNPRDGETFSSDHAKDVHIYEFPLTEICDIIHAAGFVIDEILGSVTSAPPRLGVAVPARLSTVSNSAGLFAEGFRQAMIGTVSLDNSVNYCIIASKPS